MTFPETAHPRRMTLLRVAAATWLLFISAAVVTDHVLLSKLTEHADDDAPEIAILHARVTDLAEHIEQAPHPAALTLARYQSERQELEQRLAAIEQVAAGHPTADDVHSLQTRVGQLEARQGAARTAAAAAARPRAPDAVPVRPTPIEPPFQILGTELRGGEVFLSVLLRGAGDLSQVRLLRTGEAEAGWRLDNLDGAAAVFRQGDETRRLPITVR